MNHRVYKYSIPMGCGFKLQVPKGAKVLSVGVQEKYLSGQPSPAWEEIVIWADVNPDAKLVTRRFLCVNTGEDFKHNPRKFIGTTTASDHIVWHLFELL